MTAAAGRLVSGEEIVAAAPDLLPSVPDDPRADQIAGHLEAIIDGRIADPASYHLAVVPSRDGGLAAVALRTDPEWPWMVVAIEDVPADPVLDLVAAAGERPLGFVSDPAFVTELARGWAARDPGTAPVTRMQLHLLTAQAIRHPEAPPPGRSRRARSDDAALLADWSAAFAAEALPGERPEAVAARTRGSLEQGGPLAEALHVWIDEDGAPVSMAACGARTARSARVWLVYTPPEHRSRGYAGALVATLTDRELGRGTPRVSLNADVANPVSTGLYERLGFRRVAEVARVDVVAASP